MTGERTALRGSELPIHGGIQAEADCGEVPTAHSDWTHLDPFRIPLGRMWRPDDTSGINPLEAQALGKQGTGDGPDGEKPHFASKMQSPDTATSPEEKGLPALPAC